MQLKWFCNRILHRLLHCSVFRSHNTAHSQEHSMQKATLFYLLLLSLTLYKPVYYVFNVSSVQKNFSLTFYSYGFNKIHPHHPVHVNSHFWWTRQGQPFLVFFFPLLGRTILGYVAQIAEAGCPFCYSTNNVNTLNESHSIHPYYRKSSTHLILPKILRAVLASSQFSNASVQHWHKKTYAPNTFTTTHTTNVLQPPHRSTCVSRHLQLRTGGFCWCKVLLPHTFADGSQHIWTEEKKLDFSSTVH